MIFALIFEELNTEALIESEIISRNDGILQLRAQDARQHVCEPHALAWFALLAVSPDFQTVAYECRAQCLKRSVLAGQFRDVIQLRRDRNVQGIRRHDRTRLALSSLRQGNEPRRKAEQSTLKTKAQSVHDSLVPAKTSGLPISFVFTNELIVSGRVI